MCFKRDMYVRTRDFTVYKIIIGLVFGRTVNPISTRGAGYAPHFTKCPPPGFFRPYGPYRWNFFPLLSNKTAYLGN